MQFHLVDRIVEVQPGRSIRIVKNLTLGEEYLADHFPTFPVMPGVLMLQTLIEAGSWYLRIADDFKYSIVVVREAKNVKYGHFMEPGRQMSATMELVETDGRLAHFKGKGNVEGQQIVSARISITRYNLSEAKPSAKDADDRLVAHWRSVYEMICPEGCRPVLHPESSNA